MRKTIWAVFLASASLVAACGDDDDGDRAPTLRSVVQATCDKAESCGFLGGEGAPANVDECVQAFTTCLDSESEQARNTWRDQMEDCNRIESCDGFDACYGAVPGC